MLGYGRHRGLSFFPLSCLLFVPLFLFPPHLFLLLALCINHTFPASPLPFPPPLPSFLHSLSWHSWHCGWLGAKEGRPPGFSMSHHFVDCLWIASQLCACKVCVKDRKRENDGKKTRLSSLWFLLRLAQRSGLNLTLALLQAHLYTHKYTPQTLHAQGFHYFSSVEFPLSSLPDNLL